MPLNKGKAVAETVEIYGKTKAAIDMRRVSIPLARRRHV